MLLNASKIKGYVIAASDGEVGTVTDLLFDDASWQIRWLVVETGNWLSGRKVLLPVSTLGHADAFRRQFSAKLSKQQVKDSPDVDTERPVSRQSEADIYGYYGWYPYWGYGLYTGAYSYGGSYGGVMGSPYLRRENGAERSIEEAAEAQRNRDDPHLRSIRAVEGYHIHAKDGVVGHVEDMLLDEADWSLRYLVVDTRNWWPGKKVLISPASARDISWTDRTIDLNVDRQTVKNSPAYDPATSVDREYEANFNAFYYRTGVNVDHGDGQHFNA